MPNAKRKCLYCRAYKTREDGIFLSIIGFFCNIDHAVRHARNRQNAAHERQIKKSIANQRKKDKEQRKADKARLQELKPRSWYLKEAQKWFNKFIRLRDKDKPCISCGRHHQGQYHAGHYISVGAACELRFEELNCHKQCFPCNDKLSGNAIKYRKKLIKKIGQDKVDWIEGPHKPLKLSIEGIKDIILIYKKKCKAIEKEWRMEEAVNL